jgi:restriction system protein
MLGEAAMARRKKTSPAEDLMDLVAMMPWWGGAVLALVFYVVLHGIAGREVVVNTTPGQIHTSVLPTVFKTLASIGQYILPLICLFGAVLSAVRRSKRKALITDVATSKAWQPLEGITWKEFEVLVGEAFRLQGYQVSENHAGGADGGIDLVLRKGSEKFFVQCKQWKAFSVGVAIVRELYGVMAAERAVGGFVVTSGQFTKDAEEFAKGRNVELIDGPKLMTMIRTAQAARRSSANVPRPVAPAMPANPIAAPSPVATVSTCPVCSKAMVKRTAKKGANAGQAFWGCTGYPSCRGTRPAA